LGKDEVRDTDRAEVRGGRWSGPRIEAGYESGGMTPEFGPMHEAI